MRKSRFTEEMGYSVQFANARPLSERRRSPDAVGRPGKRRSAWACMQDWMSFSIR